MLGNLMVGGPGFYQQTDRPSVQALVHRGMNQVGAIFQAQKVGDTGSSVGLRGSQQLQQAANAAVTAGNGA